MAARAIGSATISFGLVSIPVKLYAATEPGAAISFHLLHQTCGTRLKQQYICPKDEEIVAREGMVKGYEFAKGQHVVFTPEELKALEAESTQAVDITEFVPAEKVDAIYFDRPYYLGPDKGGDKAYRLLARAMEETGRSALGKYAARGKQYLVLLRPMNGALVMQQLHYADEVRSIADVPVAEIEVKEPELRLAVQLVQQIASEEFHPEAYEDEVRKKTEEQIRRKVEGEEITVEPAETGKGQIIDLMDALRASLEKAPAREKAKPAKIAEAAEKERKPARAALRAVKSGRRKSSSQ
ncbi:MAG: Ku protein [Candidatus Binatia bacterium]